MDDQATMLYLPKWRRMVLLIGILAAFALLLLRAAFIQLVPDSQVEQEIARRFERVDHLLALRGKILDRHKTRLAASQKVFEISANPAQVNTLNKSTEKLDKAIAILELDKAAVYKELKDSKKAHLVISPNASLQATQDVMALGVKGLHYKAKLERQYTCHFECGQLIGKQGRDNTSLEGYVGIERAFNAQLSGEDGFHKFIKAKKVVLEGIQAMATPKHGQDVVLSIDAKIQHFTYEALVKAVEENAKAKSGAAIVLDAKTGEILALATYPSFDPGANYKMPVGGYRNIAIMDSYEPGSTMKTFAIASGLESGLFKPGSKIDTGLSGAMRIGRNTIYDHKGYGVLTVSEVLQKSSNIGASKMAFELGRERLWNTYRQLEFGQKTNVPFNSEASGRINDFQKWADIDLAANSFGHSISVTLLQLARAYTVFANDGVMMPLSLEKRETLPVGKPVFSKETANQVLAMLRTVVSDEGTAPEARIEGYSVAGKTGTADKYDVNKGGYDKGRYVSSFVGLAPASDPSIIMAVRIDEPDTSKRRHYGGMVAGPVFSEVVSRTLNHRGVPRDMPMEPTMVVNEKPMKKVIKSEAKGT